jgi:hypothetical protein
MVAGLLVGGRIVTVSAGQITRRPLDLEAQRVDVPLEVVVPVDDAERVVTPLQCFGPALDGCPRVSGFDGPLTGGHRIRERFGLKLFDGRFEVRVLLLNRPEFVVFDVVRAVQCALVL